jgi:hypothetical protein
MNLDEFKKHIQAEREAQRLTNLEKIAKLVSTTTEKEKN